MAKACGNALLGHLQPDLSDTAVTIDEMDMQESLTIDDGPDPQLIAIDLECNWKNKEAAVTISSGGKTYATAVLRFTDKEKEQTLLGQKLKDVVGTVHALRDAAARCEADRFSRAMPYRMVASLAHYEPTHQGVQECILNSETMEAALL
jgi:hypothetical protein